MPWRDPRDGTICTLGYQVADWIEANVVIPDGVRAGDPYLLTDEMLAFLEEFYRLDPKTGEFVYYGAQLRRPQKWGKDPFAAAICLAEAEGPSRFGGWDDDGQPVGVAFPTPWVQAAACSEDQTANLFRPLYSMVVRGPLGEIEGIDPGITRINLPSGGLIEPVTSSAKSRLGQPISFGVFDETHLWTPSAGGLTLQSAMRRGLAGMDGRWIEITNAYDPADGSVAQRTAEAKAPGVLIDDRPGNPDVDPTNDDALYADLLYVYGDSARERGGWVNIRRIMAEYRDPATSEADGDRFFRNIVRAGAATFVDPTKWEALAVPGQLTAGDSIAIGFDGGLSDDTTAAVACRLTDGRLFHLRTWSRPADAEGDWRVPSREVDELIRDAFDAYNVGFMFADPHKWRDYIAAWQAAWPKRVVEFWTNSERRMDNAVERFLTATRAGELTHSGETTLTEHVRNAVLVKGGRKKAHPGADAGLSTHYLGLAKKKHGLKIDAAVAAVLAYEARAQAIAEGFDAAEGDIASNVW